MLKLPSKFTQFLLVLGGKSGTASLGWFPTKNLRLSTRIGKPSVVYPYLAGVYLSGIANTASHIWEYFGIYCNRAIHRIDAIHQTPKIILKNKLPSNRSYFRWWQNPAPVGRWCIPLLYPLFTVFRSFQ
jgi:hypothetical protein